ncbi:MAG: Ig-like domain-containing protein [Asgard group archaeon]|nr:Ig-like domain-containing protein [Asgard group archaeon]
MKTKRIITTLLLFSMLFAMASTAAISAYTPYASTPRSSTATINSPPDGATVSDTVTIEVYATTSYSMRAYLYIDGSQVDYWTSKGTHTYSWDTTQETDGSHDINLVVEEYWWWFHLSTAEDLISVTVDNGGTTDTTPPDVSITSPSEGETITSSDVTVTWTGSDAESGINYYETRIDSGSWINKGTSTSHTYTGLADGSHTVDVRAWDNAGNSNTDSVGFTIDTTEPDTTPPSITIDSPSEGETITSSDVTVTWTGSDAGSGIDYYETRIDSGSWINKGTSTSHTYTGLADGSHTVDVRAWDVAGNSATDTVGFTVDTSGGTEPVTHTFTGTVSEGSDSQKHSFNVPSDTALVEVTLDFASGDDYDLSLWDDQSQRTGGWTSSDHSSRTQIPNSQYSGYSVNPEWIDVDPPASYGTWEVGCYAYSGSGDYTITVTVTSSGPDTTPPTVTITSPADGSTVSTTDVTVIWEGSDDQSGIDYYEIRLDGGSWINKGTDTSHTFTGLSETSHTVDVQAWDVAGNSAMDTTTFTVDTSASQVTKYAVIVGISDYKAISDLSYCDEDATDWHNHLSGSAMDYDYLWVYGDGHTSNYPQHDGYATEYNVKQALQNMVSMADSDDIIAFITSGHGSGDGYGSSYLCMWDCSSGENGEDGDFYDTELAAILDDAVADRIFVFVDHCYSGGMGDDLMAMPNSAHVYCATTCTEDGYGYDDSTHQNGAWTYYFLEYSWINHYGGSATVAMETVFDYAANNYPHGGGDAPQEFDGDTSASFYMT